MTQRTAIVSPQRHVVTALPRTRTAVLVSRERVALTPRRERQTVNVVAGPRGRGASGTSAPELIISNTPPVAPTATYLRFETDGSGNVQRVFLGRP